MAGKTGQEYADDVRELRAQGVDFASASNGYILADAANWSSGQKAAVTRAIDQFDFSEFDAQEAEREREEERAADRDAVFDIDEGTGGMSEAEGLEFFADAAGDGDEEFDDIDDFDFDEGEEFVDEESDHYEESPS